MSAVTKVIPAPISRSGSWRAQATTLAPSAANRSATAWPMPELAPVTTATRSVKRSAMGGHQDLAVASRCQQAFEGAADSVQTDLAGDECVGVDAAGFE